MNSPNPSSRAASLPLQGVRVFISYRSQDADLALARQFSDALRAAGHQPFMAGESIRLGESWPARIDEELERCDYLLLLLSPEAAASEMVTEEVRKAKSFRDSRGGRRPVILPIRVNLLLSAPLNYDLAGYLGAIQQREWQSSADTAPLLEEILSILAGDSAPSEDTSLAEVARTPAATYPDELPLPTAAPELPEGQVSLASSFYVERPPIESNCYEEIARHGALIRIKAPRQMGKTSLMARTLEHAASLGYRTVPLSFQLADGSIFSNLDDLLRWFCSAVTWKLRMPDRVADSWNIPGSKLRCTDYFENYLLAELDRPLALALDEVDLVFENLRVASDFFGMLRAWHDAKDQVRWQKLRLIVVHSTEAYIPLKIHESPFNVGLPIELPELTSGQVLNLAHRHRLRWHEGEVDRLMGLVGGHPFLVRVALYHLARGDKSLQDLLATGPTEAGLYGDHLRRHMWNLEQYPELAEAVREIVFSDSPVRLSSERAFKLESMGLVRRSGNEVNLRYELYARYFRDRLRSVR